MQNDGHPLRDGLSSQAMEPQASPPKASIPDAVDGWASAQLKAVYADIELIQSTMHKFSTERGCLSSALAAIELADEHLTKSKREA